MNNKDNEVDVNEQDIVNAALDALEKYKETERKADSEKQKHIEDKTDKDEFADDDDTGFDELVRRVKKQASELGKPKKKETEQEKLKARIEEKRQGREMKKIKKQVVNESNNEAIQNGTSNTSAGKKKKEKKPKKISNIMWIIGNAEGITPGLLVKIPLALIMDMIGIVKFIFKAFLIFTVVLLLIAIIGATVLFVKLKPTFDIFNNEAYTDVVKSTAATFIPQESSYVYDADGQVLAKLRGGQDSAYLKFSEIPTDVINAYVAVEDRSFWTNPGFDAKGIIRVGVDFLKSRGDEMHGASTITQQLARNIFLSYEVSLERKAKEILVAYYLTQKYTKEEILEFYVNDICYGNGIYGIEAAALAYFNKHANELSLSQICYLCALPNSPTYYDPYVDPTRALERRDKILGDMQELHYIDDEEYKAAINEEIVIEKQVFEFNNFQTTYAVDCAVRYLMEQNGFEFKYVFKNNAEYSNYEKEYDLAYDEAKQELYNGGYMVYTSLNSDVQEQLQGILDTGLSFDSEVDEETGIYALQGAITCIDNSTGKVVALIGGRSQEDDYEIYGLNRAYQSYRQPGSSIKPLIVYAPAIELEGYTPDSTVVDIDVSKAKVKGTNVQALKGTQMTLREALTRSRNGVAWRLFDEVGPENGLKFITDMNYSKVVPDDYYNSASLGGFTYGVTTVEQASGYATLVNHGMYRDPSCIVSMVDHDGVDIYREKEAKRIYKNSTADTIIDILQDVVTKGTAVSMKWSASSEIPAAVKTGTTNDSKDGWLCGATPYYSIAVWVGYDKPRTLDNLWGNTYPAQIWKSAMLYMIDGYDFRDFEVVPDEKTGPMTLTSQSLPSDAYDKYLPGRDDSEVLSDNYTVYDYRQDRLIGEDVQSICNQIAALNVALPSFLDSLQTLYERGQATIQTVYSTKYKNELTNLLNGFYNEAQGNYNAIQQAAAAAAAAAEMQQQVPAVDPNTVVVPEVPVP